MSPLFLLLLSLSAHAEECRELRGALDIGSGSVKALAAIVDTCRKEVGPPVAEAQAALACNEALEHAGDGRIPPALREEAVRRLEGLVAKLREKGVKQVEGLATSCYRRAKNGGAVAEELGRRLKLPVRVISQEEESELGFLSAVAALRLSPDEQLSVVVWDIGGGSMQMRAQTIGEPQTFEGQLASVSFKNQVIERLQKKDLQRVSSPNPLGALAPAAVALAEEQARKAVPAYFKAEPHRRWVGIGGVLARSVQSQVKKGASSFSREELEATLKARAGLGDDAINSEFRETEITNLALTLGYMRALGIEKVETAAVSLNQGALVRAAYAPGRNAPPEPALAVPHAKPGAANTK